MLAELWNVLAEGVECASGSVECASERCGMC